MANESKADATTRLRREGRWEEASQYKERQRLRLREQGMSRKEAKEAAWDAMMTEFPPLPLDAAAAASCDVDESVDESVISEIASRSEEDADGEMSEVIRWVYDYIDRGEEQAAKSAPSTGAYSLWRWARENHRAFYEKILVQAIKARSASAQVTPRDDGGDLSGLCDRLAEIARNIRSSL